MSCSFLGVWPCPWQVEVPGPRIEPTSQQWPLVLQWQCQILSPLCHKGTTELFLKVDWLNLFICPYCERWKMKFLWWPKASSQRMEVAASLVSRTCWIMSLCVWPQPLEMSYFAISTHSRWVEETSEVEISASANALFVLCPLFFRKLQSSRSRNILVCCKLESLHNVILYRKLLAGL